MPTYQYACTECGHAFEQVQSFTDDALTVCPECQGRLRKVFNAVGVVFKGSGFYRTDSRKQAVVAETPSSASSARRPTLVRGRRPSSSSSGDSGSSSSSARRAPRARLLRLDSHEVSPADRQPEGSPQPGPCAAEPVGARS